MSTLSRRLFLRNTAAAGAAGAFAAPALPAVAAPIPAKERFDAAVQQLKAAAEELDPTIKSWDVGFASSPNLAFRVVITARNREGDGTSRTETMTPYEQAVWHIRELERLIAEDGGSHPIILVQSTYGPRDFRALCLNAHGVMKMDGDIFRRNPAQLLGGEA